MEEAMATISQMRDDLADEAHCALTIDGQVYVDAAMQKLLEARRYLRRAIEIEEAVARARQGG